VVESLRGVVPLECPGVVSVVETLRGVTWCPRIVEGEKVPREIDKTTPATRVFVVGSQQEKENKEVFCLELPGIVADINIIVFLLIVLIFDTFD
jgi:hypothetical protein